MSAVPICVQRAQRSDAATLTNTTDLGPWAMTTQHVLTLLGRKWVVSIIRELWAGPKRHFQLRLGLKGVQAKVLRDTLRSLESDGFVVRVLFADGIGGVGVGYELTPLGRTLIEPLLALFHWGELHLADVREAQIESRRQQAG